MRERFHNLIWILTGPLRWYLRAFPFDRGKGLLKRFVLMPLLPPVPAEFTASLPGGAIARLQYRETIGYSTLMNGNFEAAELDFLCRRVISGTTAMDIGANVGIFTVTLARWISADGHVMAFEPLPANIERLKRNIALNNLLNVSVFPIALGREAGRISLQLADDPAFPSTRLVADGRAMGQTIEVPVETLDAVWRAAGSPNVSVVKIDVEGAEMEVLRGAVGLLTKESPVLMVEAPTLEHLAALREHLEAIGFVCRQPKGFSKWNYIFSRETLSSGEQLT